VSERTLVHLLRHGEVHNPTGVLYGRLPGFHLSDLGRQMASRVSKAIGHRDVTTVVASPLDRVADALPHAARAAAAARPEVTA
jgi:broad specificity phosphatase PhoE